MQKLIKTILCLYLILSIHCAGIPRVATEEEYKIFQELSKYSSFVAMDSINPEAFSMNPEENVALRENGDAIMIIYVVVKAVCALYRGLVAVFGHRVSYSYTEVPMDKGYSELQQKIRITEIIQTKPGENCAILIRFAEILCRFAGISSDSSYYKSVFRAFENAKYSDSKVWGKKDFIFGNQQGEITYVSVMINRQDEEGYVYPPAPSDDYEDPICSDHERYTILFLFMHAKLQLNSNIHVERKEEHWGVWRDKTSSRIVERPRGVENEDIEALFSFFNLIAVRALADRYAPDILDEEKPTIQTSSDPNS